MLCGYGFVLLQGACFSSCPTLYYPYKGVCLPCTNDCPTPLTFTLLNITQANTTLVAYVQVAGTIPATIRQDVSNDTFAMLIMASDGNPDMNAVVQSAKFV
jgi:hypothetical protein